MEILSIYDKEFSSYGKVLDGYDTRKLIEEMKKVSLPDKGTDYLASIKSFEQLDIFKDLQERAYGGMPIELGMCWGRNRKLNGLEYHRDSELNISENGQILLLAKREEIVDGKLDTSKVRAFEVPAETVVEIYATTLHYAPCHISENGYFRSAVVLPRGTNENYQPSERISEEDKMIRARNKWLLVHSDSKEAQEGAYVGLTGENIDLNLESKEDLI